MEIPEELQFRQKMKWPNLRAIREAAGLTAAEHAKNMGTADYRNTLLIERRADWKLSTIAEYLAAMGAHADLVVRVNGQELHAKIV